MRHHLFEGKWLAALHHTEMAGELATLRGGGGSSVTESVLGHSPNNTFYMEVVSKQVAKFYKLEEWRSWLQRPTTRICHLLLGPPLDGAQLDDHLDKATK
jgi:hypothetical protein